MKPFVWQPHTHIGWTDVALLDPPIICAYPEEVTTVNEYRDMYFRYLIAKRDYPWCQHAPPSLKRVYFFEPTKVARECEREFYR